MRRTGSSLEADAPGSAGASQPGQPGHPGQSRPGAIGSGAGRRVVPEPLPPRAQRLLRISANLIGAAGAAFFAKATLDYYLQTHRLIGAAFLIEQLWVVVAYLTRRPARAVSQRTGDWLLAFGGTFGPVLFRPDGAHLHWGLVAGLV